MLRPLRQRPRTTATLNAAAPSAPAIVRRHPLTSPSCPMPRNTPSVPVPITIRPATASDAGTIIRFVRELASYERAEHEVLATPEHIRHTLFSPQPKVFGLMCEAGCTPIGFAIYFFNYSTWQGQHGLYLEDLYIHPDHRGQGAGKALLQHLARLAVEHGCGRFEWSVLDWNAPAIAFYESLGARPQSEWIRYRLSGPALQAAAA